MELEHRRGHARAIVVSPALIRSVCRNRLTRVTAQIPSFCSETSQRVLVETRRQTEKEVSNG